MFFLVILITGWQSRWLNVSDSSNCLINNLESFWIKVDGCSLIAVEIICP